MTKRDLKELVFFLCVLFIIGFFMMLAAAAFMTAANALGFAP